MSVSPELVERLENAVARLEALSGKSTESSGSGPQIAPSVVAFDGYLKSVAEPFCKSTSALMPELKEGGELFYQGFEAVRKIILAGSKGKKPKTSGMKELLAPVVKILSEIENKRRDSKGTAAWEHYSALNEASKCLQWVGVRDITVKYVKETVGAAQFYTMKILREYRTKDEKHVKWVNDLKDTIMKLADYVNEFHMTGLRFNAKADKEAQQVLSELGSDAAPKAPAAGGPPPPPPSGPPPVPSKESRSSAPGVDTGAVFDEIRKFSTKGLRKVTSDMKTKNRPKEERVAVVRASAKKAAPQKTTPKATKNEKPPRIELVSDKKWEISNQNENQDIELEEDQLKMHHAVYIFNCSDSLIQVHGKVNSISMDNCSKTSLIFTSTVAAVELVNCQSCKIQAKGKVPMISLNKTDGAQVFLSKDSATCPIYSSKSSEMNICVANEEDYDELPVPELFKTTFDPVKKILVTEPEEV